MGVCFETQVKETLPKNVENVNENFTKLPLVKFKNQKPSIYVYAHNDFAGLICCPLNYSRNG